MNVIRAVALHHYELLTPGMLHGIVLEVTKHIESLRSNLSKNAIMTLGDLFTYIQVGMDSEIDQLIEKLI